MGRKLHFQIALRRNRYFEVFEEETESSGFFEEIYMVKFIFSDWFEK